jgi:hypothetical protein
MLTTARGAIVQFFRDRGPGAGLLVVDICRGLPGLNIYTASKECAQLVLFGLLTSEVVKNSSHGLRHKFSPTAALIKPPVGAGRGVAWQVARALKSAPRGLTTTDMRYVIKTMFDASVTKRTLDLYCEGALGIEAMEGAGSQRLPRYRLREQTVTEPWVALDRGLGGGGRVRLRIPLPARQHLCK